MRSKDNQTSPLILEFKIVTVRYTARDKEVSSPSSEISCSPVDHRGAADLSTTISRVDRPQTSNLKVHSFTIFCYTTRFVFMPKSIVLFKSVDVKSFYI